MRIKSKNLYLVVLFITFIFAAASLMSLNFGNEVLATELFSSKNEVEIIKNQSIPTDTNVNDDRSGILLHAVSSGTSVNINADMCGVFELDFRAYSEKTYVQEGACYGETVKNSALSLKTFSITISEAGNSQNRFRIGIDGGSKMNFATPQAYVEVGGKKAGLYARNGNANSNNTTGANNQQRYTALWNTSFTNAAYSSQESAIDTPQQNIICFDPCSMQVYSKSSNGDITLIWDFSKSNNDGQTMKVFNPFIRFNVTLEFTDVAIGRTANVIIYSIDGQNLSGLNITDNIGPNVFVSFDQNPIKGKNFYLPEPVCYDVCGKDIKQVKVTAKISGMSLSLFKGIGIACDAYEPGCYFKTNLGGTLEVTYTAYDSSGAGKDNTTKFTVLEKDPEVEFNLTGSLNDEYGVNSIVEIPAASASSALFRSVHNIVASVSKGGSVIVGYDRKELPFTFKFDKTGDYEVEYFCVGTDARKVYGISVTDSVAFNLASTIKKSASIGDEFVVPMGIFIKNGEVITASAVIYYPDGSSFSNQKIIFEKGGKYKIEYSATVDGVNYVKNYEITVSSVSATFLSSDGKVEDGAECDLCSAITGARLEALDSTTVFKYSDTIDLSDSTKNDILVKIYSSGNWNTWTSLPTIRLTDVNDPTNVLTIDCRFGWHEYLNYVYAYAPGQIPKSWDGGKLWTSGWGATACFPGMGIINSEVGFKYQCIWISYDAVEKAIYGLRSGGLIVDFDADYQEVAWKGFSSNKVYLSISNISTVTVTEVYGNSLETKKYVDEKTPSLLIDTLGRAENDLPKAVVNKPYRIFACSVYDNWDKNAKITEKVFYNYGEENYSELEISNDCFIPKKTGEYTIEYTARDEFGNFFVKKLTINAVNLSNIVPVHLTLASGLSSNGTVGLEYELPQIGTLTGGTGNLISSINVYSPSGLLIVPENYIFIPTEAGDYMIEYNVEDYVGNGEPNQATITRTIHVLIQDEPVLYDTKLPEAILSGATLYLPNVNAIDFYTDSTGNTKPVSTVTATLNGVNIPINNNSVTPVIEHGVADLIIKYKASNVRGTSEKTYTVKVIHPDSGNGFMKEYFYTVKGTVQKSVSSSGVSLSTGDSGAAVQFINPILASNFQIKMTAPDLSRNNVDKIRITLYDYADMDISIRFEIIKNIEDQGASSKSYISINGGKPGALFGNFYNPDATFGFVYRQASLGVFDLMGSRIGYVDTTEDGQPFSGFPSKKVWAKIEYGTVGDSGMQLNVLTLNNQVFSSIDGDYIIPEFTLTRSIPLLVSLNEKFIIPSVIAQDVLSATTNTVINVQKIGGNKIISDGTNVDSEVVFTEVGNYRIAYKSTDASGKSFNQTYVIKTIEYEPPILTINGTVVGKVTLNQEINIPTVTATDNSNLDVTIVTFIIAPNYDMRVLTDSTYIPTMKGKYTIRYFAYDSSSNFQIKEIEFDVD